MGRHGLGTSVRPSCAAPSGLVWLPYGGHCSGDANQTRPLLTPPRARHLVHSTELPELPNHDALVAFGPTAGAAAVKGVLQNVRSTGLANRALTRPFWLFVQHAGRGGFDKAVTAGMPQLPAPPPPPPLLATPTTSCG